MAGVKAHRGDKVTATFDLVYKKHQVTLMSDRDKYTRMTFLMVLPTSSPLPEARDTIVTGTPFCAPAFSTVEQDDQPMRVVFSLTNDMMKAGQIWHLYGVYTGDNGDFTPEHSKNWHSLGEVEIVQ